MNTNKNTGIVPFKIWLACTVVENGTATIWRRIAFDPFLGTLDFFMRQHC